MAYPTSLLGYVTVGCSICTTTIMHKISSSNFLITEISWSYIKRAKNNGTKMTKMYQFCLLNETKSKTEFYSRWNECQQLVLKILFWNLQCVPIFMWSQFGQSQASLPVLSPATSSVFCRSKSVYISSVLTLDRFNIVNLYK